MKRPVAVVGVGQTHHTTRRSDVNIAGLVREAVDLALRDAGLEHKDIDAIVIGKAPDMLEGVAQPEQFLASAVGAHMKPMLRVHTAGSVGASTALTAVTHVASGLYDRVLTIAFEKQSEGNAMWALSPNMPFVAPLVAGAGGFFAPYCRAYIAKTNCPPHIGPMVAANARDNATRNEYAHLREPMTVDDVLNSPMLWDPIRFGETCPSSDGAIAMVVASEATAKKGPRKPAWIKSGYSYAEAMWVPGRDQVSPRAGRVCSQAVYDKAGITDPWNQIDVAEIYVPFAWFEPMWLENLGFCAVGEGWKIVDRGEQKFGAHLPINPSGGVLCSNPIGASGMIRLGEAALQVMGRAGAHQVEGAKTALGHAYGGGAQYFAMWIVSSEL
ncbi:MAG: thiolase domain-containing protein [Deltaproteobacteria bacterium]|nr:thiolase domain-containing protein [Deltaproteobacteria bacterium]MBI3389412.1 thiolase domain-containing protein [Deltaproteobacteria bacterium]